MAEDERLCRSLCGSEAEALAAIEEVIDRYSPYVVTVILNRLGQSASMEDAEELASEVFYSLWRHRSRLRTGNLRGWLAASARNCATSYARRKKPETTDIDDCITVSGDDVEKLCEQQERSRYLKNALEKLDSLTRQILVRYFYYGQSLSDISEQLSLNGSTVKSRLRRGKEKLRAELIKGGYSCED